MSSRVVAARAESPEPGQGVRAAATSAPPPGRVRPAATCAQGPRRRPGHPRTHQVKSWPLSPRSRLPSEAAGAGAYSCETRGPAGEAASMGAPAVSAPGTPRRAGAGKTGGGAWAAGGTRLRARAPALARSLACSLLSPRRPPVLRRQASGAGPDICRLQPGSSRGAGGQQTLCSPALAVEPRGWVTPHMHLRVLKPV